MGMIYICHILYMNASQANFADVKMENVVLTEAQFDGAVLQGALVGTSRVISER